MTDVELLPLELPERFEFTRQEVRALMRDYARANMEPLLAEVRERDASLGWWGRFASSAVNARKEAEARTERLAEALRKYGSHHEDCARAMYADDKCDCGFSEVESALAQEDHND